MKLGKKEIEKIILIACVIILFCAALANISTLWTWFKYLLGVLIPVILGLAVAFLMTPLAGGVERFLEKPNLRFKYPGLKHKVARPLSTTLAFLIVVAVLAMIVVIIVPEIKEAATALAESLPVALNTVLDWLTILAEEIGLEVDFSNFRGMDILTIYDYLSDIFRIDTVAETLFGGVMGVATSVVGGIFTFAMGVVVGFRLILQREDVGRFFRRFVKAYFSEKTAKRIFDITHLTTSSFRNFMSGQLTEALVLGIMCLIGMKIFGFPYSGAVSAVIGLGAIIPIFGAWIAGVIGFLLILSVSPIKALLFVVYLVCLQTLDNNFVYPRIIGNSMDLPSLLVFLAVLIGGDIAGFLGMLLGVPFCSIVYTLVKESIDSRLKKKNLQSEEQRTVRSDESAGQ